MNAGKSSIAILLSFLIIMFMTVIGCGSKQATSVLSGTVTGDNVDGLTINMTGAATISTTTDASGEYSFNNVDNGLYIITPYRDGFSFDPANVEVYISGASATNVDFTLSWAGYSISGDVTGDAVNGVKVTAYILNTTSEVVSVTTNSDGNYSLTDSSIISGNFYVKPSLLGYKFTPFTQSVTINNASKKISDFVSKELYTSGAANGTYTWDSTTGDMTITWSSANAPCNWPKSGTVVTESKVTISAKTMIWRDETKWPGMMIWTRTKSTVGDPAGEWTSTDQSGNKYTATFTNTSTTRDSSDSIVTASGSISLSESIIACSYVWVSSGKQASISYQDPGGNAASNVIVTGSGISTSLELVYNGAGEWNTGAAGNIDVSSIVPPYYYTFTVTDTGTSWEEISCSVDWPTDLEIKEGTSPKLPKFSWTAAGSGGATYIVQLRDSNYIWMWESIESTDTYADYPGPTPLVNGRTYHYYVIVTSASDCSHGKSFVEGTFTYTGP